MSIFGSGYWDRTDSIMRENGGVGPPCPSCNQPMFPQDDHGRFKCFHCPDLDNVPGLGIPQVDTASMTDQQKATIPPINRLNGTMTAAEQRFMQIALKGPDTMDTKEYWDASRAVEEERRQASEQTEKT